MPLTAEPQKAAPRYYNPHLGDVDEFIIQNKDLVYSVAYRCRRKTRVHVDVEDLVQEGYRAFLRAYSDFDPTKGEFTTFAVPKMRGVIMNYIRDKVHIIRPPRKIYELAGRIMLKQKSDLSPDELVEEFGCSRELITQALKQIESANPYSLFHEITVVNENRAVELIEFIETTGDFTGIYVYEFKHKVLTERERIVLELSLVGISQQVIAEHLNCSQMTVSRAYQRVQMRAAKYFGIEVT